jgi:hypothetical protein
MMSNCDETREHLEACEDCRLHVVVEARLRTLPVLEPPKGLVERAMKALPRVAPVRREFFRLAAAAVMLIGLTIAAFQTGVAESSAATSVKARTGQAIESTSAMLNAWRSELWKQ